MAELVKERPRAGCRSITRLLKDEGWRVNYKRIHRLWKQEGYKVPRKRKKKRAMGDASNACDKRSARHRNDVWAWDFIHDRTLDGKALKFLVIVDEYTRENLALDVRRSIKGGDVLDTLSRLFGEHGAPRHIRSDNGSEFIAGQVQDWVMSLGVETLYIEPGAPWQNGYAEAFNSRLRDEFLEMNYFHSVKEAQALAKRWRDDYNTKRPHSSLKYMTPVEFARHCGPSGSGSGRGGPPKGPPSGGMPPVPQNPKKTIFIVPTTGGGAVR
jgi:transposase InsO family protein